MKTTKEKMHKLTIDDCFSFEAKAFWISFNFIFFLLYASSSSSSIICFVLTFALFFSFDNLGLVNNFEFNLLNFSFSLFNE